MHVALRWLMAAMLPLGILFGWLDGRDEQARYDLPRHVALKHIFAVSAGDRAWLVFRCEGRTIAASPWGSFDRYRVFHRRMGAPQPAEPGLAAGFLGFLTAAGETGEVFDGSTDALQQMSTSEAPAAEGHGAFSQAEATIDILLVGTGQYFGYRLATRNIPPCNAPLVLAQLHLVSTWQNAAIGIHHRLTDMIGAQHDAGLAEGEERRSFQPDYSRAARGDYDDGFDLGYIPGRFPNDIPELLRRYRAGAHKPGIGTNIRVWIVRLAGVGMALTGLWQVLRLLGTSAIKLLDALRKISPEDRAAHAAARAKEQADRARATPAEGAPPG
jgi:hypothetical protein